MKRIASLVLSVALISISLSAFAQAGSEIYLFEMVAGKNKVVLRNGVNVTKHPGYDNQPFFHPVEKILYYSSFNADGRADLMAYDYDKQKGFAITQTNEREYSPTVTLDQEFLSCIIQRDNGAQDLGKYPIDGGEPVVILDHLIIGYHVWADNSHLGLFVLGDPDKGTPHSLHYLRLPTRKDTVLATNIGRSLHRVPGETAISYVQKVSEKEAIIKKVNTTSMAITEVTRTINGRDDLCWVKNGLILMSDGSKIVFFNPKAPAEGWREVEIDKSVNLAPGISRLAASADGKRLAIVLAE